MLGTSSNRSTPLRLFRETSTARSDGARQNEASMPPWRELPERSTVRRLDRLPSSAQSTGPVRLRDGKWSRRTGRHARWPGNGGWKLETFKNAARTNSTSGSRVQLEEPLASAAAPAAAAAACFPGGFAVCPWGLPSLFFPPSRGSCEFEEDLPVQGAGLIEWMGRGHIQGRQSATSRREVSVRIQKAQQVIRSRACGLSRNLMI
ncbi:hypothetical protein PAHAL_1G102500 [Panicum hallii]|uniref:Uncharacterized protein n=1 Tax=Panicum hallii TaxID=206008 RepID=A0A2S3GN86_9POAL|nr:hypothetical protein PAHAL_1G102500 [Panicum hallii]